jgi:hypothetical protein
VNLFLVERWLRHNRSSMPQDSLYLTIYYESGQAPNGSPSTLAFSRIEQHASFRNVARIALDQAEKRGDETTRLERLLEAILPGFKEN